MQNNFCGGCRDENFCLLADFHSALCPCRDCIVKMTCDNQRSNCDSFKKFMKKHLKEAIKREKAKNFTTRISMKKKK
jgi:hypothetical protein